MASCSEQELVDSVLERLHGGRKINYCVEAPVLGRSVDLAILKDNQVITIEFKVNDWNKGLKQAKDYSLASDFVYLCLPSTKRVHSKLISKAEELGLGILKPNLSSKRSWPFDTIVEAKKISCHWNKARISLISFIQENHIKKKSIERKK